MLDHLLEPDVEEESMEGFDEWLHEMELTLSEYPEEELLNFANYHI